MEQYPDDPFKEVLRDHLREIYSETAPELLDKVNAAESFGDLVNIIYYDAEVGLNDYGMLLTILYEAGAAQG